MEDIDESLRATEPPPGEEEEVALTGIGEKIDIYRERLYISGKAFNMMKQAAGDLVASTSRLRPVDQLSKIKKVSFEEVCEQAEIIQGVFAEITKYLRKDDRKESERPKNRCTIEELVEKAKPIEGSEYCLKPETDLRREYNRLVMLTDLYGSLFEGFVKQIFVIVKYGRGLQRSKEDGGYLNINLKDLVSFRTAAVELDETVTECSHILLEADEKKRISEIVRSATDIARICYDQKRIGLDIATVGDSYIEERAYNELKNALVNVLLAKQYNLRETESPMVTVESRADGISIVDNGPHIPHEDTDEVFEIAARYAVEEGRTGDIHLARESLRAHDGDVHATNLDRGGVEMLLKIPPAPRVPDEYL
jgi:hypothetical protein